MNSENKDAAFADMEYTTAWDASNRTYAFSNFEGTCLVIFSSVDGFDTCSCNIQRYLLNQHISEQYVLFTFMF